MSSLQTDYNSGMPLKDLRKKYRTTSIYYNTGIVPNRKQKLTQQDHEAIIKAYKSGMYKTEMIATFNVSWQKIKIILKGYNVPLRERLSQRGKENE